jgi:hypothetical protein
MIVQEEVRFYSVAYRKGHLILNDGAFCPAVNGIDERNLQFNENTGDICYT